MVEALYLEDAYPRVQVSRPKTASESYEMREKKKIERRSFEREGKTDQSGDSGKESSHEKAPFNSIGKVTAEVQGAHQEKINK